MTTPRIEEIVKEFEDLAVTLFGSYRDEEVSWLTQTLQAERQRYEEMVEAVEKRNGVIKEYKDEGVMFILKVVDGKTYEASMPIPKWAEVGKVQLRDHSELDQDIIK